MKPLKLILLFFLSLVLLGVTVYLFVVPFSYKINFKTKNAPWFLYHSLKRENHIKLLNDKQDEFRFTFIDNDNKTRLEWKLSVNKDQKTHVTVYVFLQENPWVEKINVILGRSIQVKNTIEKVKNFYRDMLLKDTKYRWEEPQQGSFPESTCLCQKINTKISEKANQMNRNIDALSFYLPKTEKSPPLLYINRLDLKQQTIEFDLCFKVPDDYVFLQQDKTLFVDKKQLINGQKQSFYGNYNESHRSWFNLIARLSKEKQTLRFPLVEVFHDSPFSETNDVNWHSELYFDVN